MLDGDSVIKEFIRGIGKRKQVAVESQPNAKPNINLNLNILNTNTAHRDANNTDAYQFRARKYTPSSATNNRGAGVIEAIPDKHLRSTTNLLSEHTSGARSSHRVAQSNMKSSSYSSEDSPFRKVLTERSVHRFINS